MIIDTALTVNRKKKRKMNTQVFNSNVNQRKLKGHVHRKDIVCCIEFFTDGKSANHPIKMLELFENQQHKHAMSFG